VIRESEDLPVTEALPTNVGLGQARPRGGMVNLPGLPEEQAKLGAILGSIMDSRIFFLPGALPFHDIEHRRMALTAGAALNAV